MRQRSTGVTVISILAFLGSLFTLALAGLMAVVFIAVPDNLRQSPEQPRLPMAFLGILLIAVYLLPSIWGMMSSVGLWRLKNWARISTIVFAVLLCVMGAFGFLVALVMPMVTPSMPTTDPHLPNAALIVKTVMLLFATAELAVGVWWGIYFTRRSVVAEFIHQANAVQPSAPYVATLPSVAVETPRNPKPVSTTVIGWLLLAGSAFIPLSLFMHTPILLFGKLLEGPAAIAVTLLFAVANVYIGIGLLRLWPQARIAGIAYFTFALLNSALTWLRPGSADLFRRVMAAQPKWFGPAPDVVFPPSFIITMGIAGSLVTLIPIYFLVTRKAAFMSRDERLPG